MFLGNSLAVQWLGLSAFTVEVPGSIPGQGTKISQAMLCGKKKKKGIFRNCDSPVLVKGSVPFFFYFSSGSR